MFVFKNDVSDANLGDTIQSLAFEPLNYLLNRSNI